MVFFIVVHVIACTLLIILILIQRGHGGGLLESFSGVESMFGTKTNEFLARFTTILAVIFFITCIGLALFSVRQGRSLMQTAPKAAAAPQAAGVQEVPPVAPVQPANPAQ